MSRNYQEKDCKVLTQASELPRSWYPGCTKGNNKLNGSTSLHWATAIVSVYQRHRTPLEAFEPLFILKHWACSAGWWSFKCWIKFDTPNFLVALCTCTQNMNLCMEDMLPGFSALYINLLTNKHHQLIDECIHNSNLNASLLLLYGSFILMCE